MRKALPVILLLITWFSASPLPAQDFAGNFLNRRKALQRGWTRFEPGIRAGLGTQGTIYGEFGLALYRNNEKKINERSEMLFAGLELVPTLQPEERQVYGFKLGIETTINSIGLGVESKIQTDGQRFDVVFTPKVGISMLGVLSLYYGFNISTEKYPFANAGDRMFTLTILFNTPRSVNHQ